MNAGAPPSKNFARAETDQPRDIVLPDASRVVVVSSLVHELHLSTENRIKQHPRTLTSNWRVINTIKIQLWYLRASRGEGGTGERQKGLCVEAGAGMSLGHAVCKPRRYTCTRRYTQPTVTIRLKVFHAHSPPCESLTPIRQLPHPSTALQCLPRHTPLASRPTRRLLPTRGEGADETVRGA